MAIVTWIDPLGVACSMECLTLDEAYSYEAALECSGVATNVHVSDPAWDLLMDERIDAQDAALHDLMDHMYFDHADHVRTAEAHYWEADHSSHVMQYFDTVIPF